MARQGSGKSARSQAHGSRVGQGGSAGRGNRVGQNGAAGRNNHAGQGSAARRSGSVGPGGASGRNGSAAGRHSTGSNKPSAGSSRPAAGGNKSAHRRQGKRADAARRVAGEFIEGRRAAAEALRTGFPVKRALVAESSGRRDAALTQLIEQLCRVNVPVEYVAPEQLDALSSHGAHQGVALEVGAFPYADLADIIARAGNGPALVVVLDHVTDAGNFGAIVRSAEVVGAAGVVIANKRAAEVNVGAYKTSAGAVMHLPIARVPNIARALEDLKAAGFWAIGASEHAEGNCWNTPLTGRIALVMGSEGEGISRLVLDTCDDLTKLPQRGQTESLNVAQATTALCYEWLRVNIAACDAAAPSGANANAAAPGGANANTAPSAAATPGAPTLGGAGAQRSGGFHVHNLAAGQLYTGNPPQDSPEGALELAPEEASGRTPEGAASASAPAAQMSAGEMHE